MKSRILSVALIMGLALTLVVRADPPTPKPPANGSGEDVKQGLDRQAVLLQQFREFEKALYQVARNLERSPKPEDRQRAANLKKAIAIANSSNTEGKFDKLIGLLKKDKTLQVSDLTEAIKTNGDLSADLRKLIDLLLADNRDAELKRQIRTYEELIKQLEKVIRNQKLARTNTEFGRMDKGPLGKMQKDVTKQTQQIARSMSKPGDSDSQGGKSGSKSDSDSKDGKGSKGGKSGTDSQGGQQGQQSQQGQQGQQGDQQQSDNMPGRKKVQDAIARQKQAEENIKNDKNQQASNNQDDAIKKLEEARKKLEEILKQLREEEMERLLAALQARCERMLRLQIEIYEGTKRVDEAIRTSPDKNASRLDVQKSLELSDREKDIVRDADQAVGILQQEGSAVAFPEAFVQVRDDASHVARRLNKVDVGSVTQVIEQDIIATLKDMIDALKKKRKQMEANKNSGESGSQQNQKLIDILAELKMIRAMQVRVNGRTKAYARQYTGEQANDPDIQKELSDLSQRQQKIFQITDDLYRGKNK